MCVCVWMCVFFKGVFFGGNMYSGDVVFLRCGYFGCFCVCLCVCVCVFGVCVFFVCVRFGGYVIWCVCVCVGL